MVKIVQSRFVNGKEQRETKKKSNILTTNRNTSMAFFLAEGKQKKYIVHQV